MFHYRNIMWKNAESESSSAPVTTTEVAAPPKVKPATRPGRRRKPVVRSLILLIFLAVAAGAGWWFYLRPQPVVAPPTVAVARGDVQETVLATGILEASSLVSVGAQVSGRIEKLDVKLGDVVKTGDVLAEIDSHDQQNAVNSAQAALAISNARLHAQTVELSFTDPLTGMANRRSLFTRLEQELVRALRFGDALSLLMIDLDHFKDINDAHGHAAGDRMLHDVAEALRRTVRKVDLVARFGGEEFCVVLPRVARPEAIEVAEKLRRVIESEPFRALDQGPALRMTISIGVAAQGPNAADVSALLSRADEALYAAKRRGRNNVSASVT